MYLENKFHPDLIWNDKALGFFEERRQNKKKNERTRRWVETWSKN